MNVAFIPVRGGSKSIPLKNIKLIAGKPLVYWVTKAASECDGIDKVYISTDSEIIKDTVESFKLDKICVIGRSEESASDVASTEMAMLEFAAKYEFDNIVLIQATSPLLKSSDLRKGFEAFFSKDVDSVLSVVRQKRFIWELIDEAVIPKNYDIFNRPRRQEFDGYLVENGAFYITSRKALIESKNRISGKIKAVEMAEESYYEIDEPIDFTIIERLLLCREKENNIITKDIRMFLTDCDGVLTDGGMYYSERGDELKKFNTKDGKGLVELKQRGIIVGIITGEEMSLNQRRAEKLKLDEIVSGCGDKVLAVKELCEKYKVPLEKVVYIGDDVNDLDVIKMVGWGCCPADANNQVKAYANYVTKARGGEGAVRELADLIISQLE